MPWIASSPPLPKVAAPRIFRISDRRRAVRGGRIGAGDQRPGRHAAGVHASSLEQLALDERDGHSGIGQPACKRWTDLPGAYDDCVKVRNHGCPPVLRRPHSIGRSKTLADHNHRDGEISTTAMATAIVRTASSQRQILAPLLSDYVLGVPVRPVLIVRAPGPLLVLAVRGRRPP